MENEAINYDEGRSAINHEYSDSEEDDSDTFHIDQVEK